MPLKVIISASLFLTISFFGTAQKSIAINYSDSSTIFLNNLMLNKKTDARSIIADIGNASSINAYPNGERDFFYENYGLVIMTKDTLLTGLGINYNWDGDKKLPITSFTGTLKIGELSITKGTKKDDINSIKAIGFGCPMDILCASKSRAAKVRCSAAFNAGAISQIVFLFN